jgi:hypothetical protein
MSCCGKSTTAASPRASLRAGPSWPAAGGAPRTAYVRCIGRSTVVMVGPVSGKMYRFPSSGQIVEVDARDALSLARVPQLHTVRYR